MSSGRPSDVIESFKTTVSRAIYKGVMVGGGHGQRIVESFGFERTWVLSQDLVNTELKWVCPQGLESSE